MPHVSPYIRILLSLGLLIIAPLLPLSAVQAQEAEITASPTPAPSPTLIATPTPPPVSEEELKSRQEELKRLEETINALAAKNAAAGSAADLAAGKLDALRADLEASQLQLWQLEATTAKTVDDIDLASAKLRQLELQTKETRQKLASSIRGLHQHGRFSWIDLLLNDGTLSGFFAEEMAYRALQAQLYESVRELRDLQDNLQVQKKNLEERVGNLQKIQAAQMREREELAAKQQEQKNFVSLKQEEQARYERQLTDAMQAKEEIKNSIFRLKSLNQELKLDDVYDAARYAAKLTGVRPALLLGILKVETNLGANVGSGVFPEDMHPDSIEPFLRLTKQLGRDPYKTPISRRPTSYQGWGGAMGPAQVMPATWESIAGRIASHMQKPVADPFNLADALVAIGIMMADRGAADRGREVEAVARYLAGPNWEYHLWYSQRVLAVAAEYEAGGLK